MTTGKPNEFKMMQLSECPEYLETVAEWVYKEWWKTPDNTIEVVLKQFREQLVKDTIPFLVVALKNQIPIGCCSVIENDCSHRRQYTPWLAGVIVLEKYRGLSIGTKMVQEAFKIANSLNIDGVYIDCAKKTVPFYEKNKWKLLEIAEEVEDTYIMFRKKETI